MDQAFTFESARAFVESWAENTAADANAKAKEYYEQRQSPDYVNNVIRCRELGIAAPEKPVPAFKVVVIEVPTNDGRTWPDISVGNEYVCPVVADVPVADIPPPGAHVGVPIGIGYYQCLPGDTIPMGGTIPYLGLTLVKERGIFGVPVYRRL